jgi:hypothetical protein
LDQKNTGFLLFFKKTHHTTLHNMHGWQHKSSNRTCPPQPAASTAAAAAAARIPLPMCPPPPLHTAYKQQQGSPCPCSPSPHPYTRHSRRPSKTQSTHA